MTLDLLDLLLISQFCFDKSVPWWLWILGVISTIGNGYTLKKMRGEK